MGKCMQTLTTFICIERFYPLITVHSNSSSASNPTKVLAADKHNNMNNKNLKLLHLTMGALVLVKINFDRQ